MLFRIKTVVQATIADFRDLGPDDQLLLKMAGRARLSAQAPYSNYGVGAAVKTENDTFYAGCNVERVSYSQGSHAEQNAIDTMVTAEGASRLTAVAVVAAPVGQTIDLYAPSDAPLSYSFDTLCSPSCGHCLQIIWENCGGDTGVRLLSRLTDNRILVVPIGSVWTMRFGPEDLGIDPCPPKKGV